MEKIKRRATRKHDRHCTPLSPTTTEPLAHVKWNGNKTLKQLWNVLDLFQSCFRPRLRWLFQRFVSHVRGAEKKLCAGSLEFLPARRYASAVFARRVRLSVRHTPVLCLGERKQDREMYTIWEPHDSSFWQGMSRRKIRK